MKMKMKMNTVKFKTRISKNDAPVETTADFNWESVTEDQLKSLAERSVIIMVQAAYRTAGHVPATDSVNIASMLNREKGGFKATPEALAGKINKMSDDDRNALMALLMKETL